MALFRPHAKSPTFKQVTKSTLFSALTVSGLLFAPAVFSASIPLDSVTKDIRFLASDDLKGRKVFTPEIDEAALYIASRFKALGLQPLSTTSKDANSYLQSFEIFSINPVSINVALNGKPISKDKIAFASTAKSINWAKADVNADVHTNANADVHNKENTEKVTQHFIGKSDNLRQTFSKLNRQGGNHLIIIDPAHEPMFKRYQSYFSRGLTKLTNEDQGTLVAVISEVGGNGENVEREELKSFEVSGKTSASKKALNNVVGVLPGKSKADELVLYTAHYDHLGTSLREAKDGNGDIVFNGADDNASGVTGVLNLAQYFSQATKQNNNERTLMFVAFTAEEIGGYGSQYFSTKVPADSVTAMINIEMVGKPSKFGEGRLWMTGKERSNLGDIMNADITRTLQKASKSNTGKLSNNDDLPLIEADPYPEQNLFYRSDNATLARLGVPAHSFSSVQLANDKHYHALSDDVTTLNLNSLKTVIETLAVGSKSLISGEATPTRVDVSEVTPQGKIY